MSQPKRRTVLSAHVESQQGGAILEKASSHDEAFSYLTHLLCAKAMSQTNRRTALSLDPVNVFPSDTSYILESHQDLFT